MGAPSACLPQVDIKEAKNLQNTAEQRLRKAEVELADRDAAMAPGRAQVRARDCSALGQANVLQTKHDVDTVPLEWGQLPIRQLPVSSRTHAGKTAISGALSACMLMPAC